MNSIGKHWHVALFIVAIAACGESHSSDDGGTTDTGTDTGTRTDTGADAVADSFGGDDCPPVGAPMCVRGPCCDEDLVFADPIPGTCDFACPDGWVEQALCDIAPGCGRFDSCSGNEDCELSFNTCCGVCGVPELSDYDAINVERREDHRAMVCPEPVACPDCVAGFNPNLGASCEVGTCRGFDLSMTPLSECSDDVDCRVRAHDCCECGADTSFGNLIAIRGDAVSVYETMVCPSDFACLECAPAYPDDVRAFCDAGRCALERVPEP